MEKRTLLAIFLSIIILYIYNVTIVKKMPDSSGGAGKLFTQTIANKEIAIDSNVVTPVSPKIIKDNDILAEVPENVQTIENENLEVGLSSLGGSIKSVKFLKYQYTFPLTRSSLLPEFENANFQSEKISTNEIVYTFSDKDFFVQKRFTFTKQKDGIETEFVIKNTSALPQSRNVQFNPFTIDLVELSKGKNFASEQSLLEYSFSLKDSIIRKNNAFKFSQKENIIKAVPINWVGYRDRYFCALVKPSVESKGYSISQINDKRISFGVDFGKIDLNPGKSFSFKTTSYFGTQDVNALKLYDMNFEEIVRFSNFSILDIISKLIIETTSFFHKYIKSWGFSIILISFIIYFLLYPLSLKSTYSMRKMQSLQPKIEKLKEQYKGNSQKLNAEIMELYKKNNVNPLSGCLPVVLQMPVFIGLYQALWRSVYFKGVSFLWIKDLAEPDKFMILPFNLPYIGNEFNLLPVIVTFFMFLQQKIYSKNVVVTDPAQLMQQKLMSTLFPVMFGFLFYKFSSGLFLYFTVFYFLTVVTQWHIMKRKDIIVS